MKLKCPKCSKPYQISEQDIREEAIRIRCSSCGAAFKIRGKKKEQPSTKVVEAPEKQFAWFAIVGKQRVGPFGYKALSELVDKGKVDANTLLWRKGLDSWTTASQIPDLSELFAPSTPASPPAPPPLPPPIPPRSSPDVLAKKEETSTTTVSPDKQSSHSDEQLSQAEDTWEGDKNLQASTSTEDSHHGFFLQGDAPRSDLYSSEIEMEEPVLEIQDLDSLPRGARETLRDFSVMARISSRSRKRSIFVLTGLGTVFAFSLFLVFYFGEAVEFKGKQRELVWENNEDGPNIFARQRSSSKSPVPSAESQTARESVPAQRKKPLDLPELNQDLSRDFSYEESVSLDREELRRRLQNASKEDSRNQASHPGRQTWGENRKADDDDPSLNDFVIKGPARKSPIDTGSSGGGITRDREAHRLGSSSDFLTRQQVEEGRVGVAIKERKSEGGVWQMNLRNNVVRKINAERRRIQACADNAGVSSGVRVVLDIHSSGQITDIDTPEGGASFRNCLMATLGSWKAGRQLPRDVKLPVRLHFE